MSIKTNEQSYIDILRDQIKRLEQRNVELEEVISDAIEAVEAFEDEWSIDATSILNILNGAKVV